MRGPLPEASDLTISINGQELNQLYETVADKSCLHVTIFAYLFDNKQNKIARHGDSRKLSVLFDQYVLISCIFFC